MTRINFAQFVERKRDEGSVPIDMPDGSEVVIPPPVLWPELADAAPDAIVVAILGEEQATRYLAQGGTFKLLAAIFEEAQGVTMGEAPASPGS